MKITVIIFFAALLSSCSSTRPKETKIEYLQSSCNIEIVNPVLSIYTMNTQSEIPILGTLFGNSKLEENDLTYTFLELGFKLVSAPGHQSVEIHAGSSMSQKNSPSDKTTITNREESIVKKFDSLGQSSATHLIEFDPRSRSFKIIENSSKVVIGAVRLRNRVKDPLSLAEIHNVMRRLCFPVITPT